MGNYKHTVRACFVGYIVQAIVVNFPTLLFVTFQSQYGLPLKQVTLLITVNFILQLITDFASAFLIDKIGYRKGIILAHILSATGLVMMTILPDVLPSPFAGLLTAVSFCAVGSGLLEVLISPMVEACPTENKAKMMSLLHSFYCWGSVAVVAVSTVFFSIAGIANWKIMTLIWALIPISNTVVFTKVPIAPLIDEGEEGMSIKDLVKTKIFWLFMLLIICSGASEQAVNQWASAFAERGLGVSKTVGDLVGPMLFAILMGISRLIYGKFGEKIDLGVMMLACGGLCIISYLIIGLTDSAVLGLIGVAVSGFAVGIMWPGTFSKASATIKSGGTAMFALLALGGDLGCSSGPTFAGLMASRFGDDLQKGILSAIVFPVALTVTVVISEYIVPHIKKSRAKKNG